MQNQLKIAFHGVDPSEFIESRIRERAAKLERHFDRILGCRVVVDAPHKHHKKGQHYHVRIDLSVPGNEIVVNRDPRAHTDHEDVYVAIRDAFDAAGRALDTYAQKRRGDTKHHDRPEPA
jgi:ribosomal subunit interface protein